MNAMKELLQDQPYRWISAGVLMRQRGVELGMPNINVFAEYNRLHPEEGHDRWCDDAIARLAQEDWMICESRLSHYFMPGAFKVLLFCDVETRAARRQGDLPGQTLGSVLREIRERDNNDDKRYAKLYPGCLWEPGKFDAVYNTESLSSQDIARNLIFAHAHWSERRSMVKGNR